MLVRLTQAIAITLALYGLLSLNAWQQTVAAEAEKTQTVKEPPEVIVAIKEVFKKTKR